MLNDFMMSLRNRVSSRPQREAPDTPSRAFLLSMPPDKPLWLPAPAVIRTLGQANAGRVDFLLSLVDQAIAMQSAVVYVDGGCRASSWRAMTFFAAKMRRAHQVLAQAAPLAPREDCFTCLEQGALLFLAFDYTASISLPLQMQHTLRALRNTFATRRRQAKSGSLRPLLVVLDDCCVQSGQMAPEVVALAADAVCVGVTLIISDQSSNYDLPDLDVLVDCHVYQHMEKPLRLAAPCRRRLRLQLKDVRELSGFVEGIGVVCVRSEPPVKVRQRPARTSLAYTRVDLNAK